jgi:DNA-directed RNA polymerase specialized sigma24 family protein
VPSENTYEGVLKAWVAGLIERRARRLGFKEHEIPDVQQEIAMVLVNTRCRPGPASERTCVTRIIDLQACKILRARKRDVRRANYEKASAKLLDRPGYYGMSEVERTSLRLDTEAAMTGLSPVEKSVLHALTRGESQADIARSLGRSRSRVCEIVAGLRARLRRHGLGPV